MDSGGADPNPGEHGLEEVDGTLGFGKDEGLFTRHTHVVLVQEFD